MDFVETGKLAVDQIKFFVLDEAGAWVVVQPLLRPSSRDASACIPFLRPSATHAHAGRLLSYQAAQQSTSSLPPPPPVSDRLLDSSNRAVIHPTTQPPYLLLHSQPFCSILFQAAHTGDRCSTQLPFHLASCLLL